MSKRTRSILFTLCFVAGIYAFLWGKWYFIEDFGPYYVKLISVPDGKPDQVFRVNSNLSLESYDPKTGTESPIVVARDGKGKVLWSATTYGADSTFNLPVRFVGSLTVPFTDSIRLKVEFGSGDDDPSPTPALWLLERDGSFRKYFIFT